MFRKLMVLLVSLAMVIGMVPMVAAADNLVFSDMPNDWSTPALEKAVVNGLITGYDGKIMPKENLTRAQMAAIVNRSFGATVKASLQGFTDVALDAWYYNDMAKAVQMKTFKGDAGKLNPNAPITREEAFAVIARAFKLGSSEAIPNGFADLGNISSWATGEVYGLINAGYIEGSNGYINPKNNITRAEFAQVMDNILKSYVKVVGEYTELPEGNVMVNVAGVTLKDLTVAGDLIIGEGVGDGDFTLDNVTVTGRMVVRGGGENSIIIKGSSTVGQVIVARVDGAVRIVVEGSTVEVIYINDGTDDVIIEGNIEDLVVQAPNAQVVVPEGSSIANMVINKEAQGSTITVEGTVENIVTEAPNTIVEGTGTVTNVEIKAGANNSTIITPETIITVKAGVVGTIGTGGTAIAAGTTVENNSDVTKAPVVEEEEPSTGGGSGGGGGTTPDPIILESASLAGADVDITGDTINVKFALGSTPRVIIANFNKAVEITKLQVGSYIADTPATLEAVQAIIGVSLPTEKSSTLTLTITKPITDAQLVKYGNTVKVTVSTGTESEVFTINLTTN